MSLQQHTYTTGSIIYNGYTLSYISSVVSNDTQVVGMVDEVMSVTSNKYISSSYVLTIILVTPL